MFSELSHHALAMLLGFQILYTMCLHACPSRGKFKYLWHVMRHVRIAE